MHGTESRQGIPRIEGLGNNEKSLQMAMGSFWSDENVLKLIMVIVAQL